MSLVAGARLGPYEIVGALGAGGMGEVYKARDTRLNRDVAIKVLADWLAADPQFRARFEREARTISQLDHPNICALHDVGVDGGTSYLVLQYVDGETLDKRLERGPMKLDEALPVAIQIAAALDRAHRAGIIHRDVKPGNVMLANAAGRVQAKLLDFGLAKMTAGVIAATPTVAATSSNLTARGAILGTFQYMAPEQLEGRDADARTDLFAFGAVVYEMITGRKAFEGTSEASVIAAILERDPPPLSSLEPLAPASLDHIISKCLAKNPEDRWQSARDVMSELSWLLDIGRTVHESGTQHVSRARPERLAAYVISGILAGLAIGATATRLISMRPERTSPDRVARVLVSTAPAEHLQAFAVDQTTNEGRPSRTSMVWSPDGRSIVFGAAKDGRQQLYLRALGQLEATPIAGTEDASNPFFSPDGRWLGFILQRALWKVDMAGGPPTPICQTGGVVFGASWGDDGSIVYSLGRDGLWRVSGSGGTPERLTRPDRRKGELKQLLPQVLPGSRAVLFTLTHTPLPKWDDTDVMLFDLSSGQQRKLVAAGGDGRYVDSGHLLYMERGTLMAAPFDLVSLRVTGGAVGVVAGVMQAANTTNDLYDSGAGQFAVSSTGSLLYVPGGIFPDPERTLAWVNRRGVEQPLPMPVRAYLSPRLAPDGTMITVWTQGDRNVWIGDLSRQSLTRINMDGRNTRGIWSPDGKRIALSSTLGGTDENAFVVSADGSGTAERLTTCDCQSYAAAWSPDGRTILAVENRNAFDIVRIDIDEPHRSIPLLYGKSNEYYPDISPDGRWIAYASDESGQNEVYVQPFPGLGSRHQVSTEGGTSPAWSHDGRELFYLRTGTLGGQASSTKMMVVSTTLGPPFVAGPPRQLFEGRYGATAVIRPYDVTRDGQRFLMVKQRDRALIVASQMILVQNWFEELKQRVPPK